jgi:hypothetical protein
MVPGGELRKSPSWRLQFVDFPPESKLTPVSKYGFWLIVVVEANYVQPRAEEDE